MYVKLSVKILCPLLALSFLLAGCSSELNDSKIQHKLIGAWAEGQDGITYYPDGVWVGKYTQGNTNEAHPYSGIYDGTWAVKNGLIIITTSKTSPSPYPDSVPS